VEHAALPLRLYFRCRDHAATLVQRQGARLSAASLVFPQSGMIAVKSDPALLRVLLQIHAAKSGFAFQFVMAGLVPAIHVLVAKVK
jgi:hypothetical protein